jgi:hypothetical protein
MSVAQTIIPIFLLILLGVAMRGWSGLLAASHPHLDMISFGPDICGAHAPGERVEIKSVAHCWQLLKAVLQALAKA